MAVYLCVPCATGDCGECRRHVTRGRVTKPCSCRHDPGRVVRTGDPRAAGGQVITVDGGEVLVDTRNAVLVDATTVSAFDNPSDARQLVALFLEGRVNRTDRRSAILHLLDAGGTAVLVAELVGLAARMGPVFEAEFRTALDSRLDAADLWPAVVPAVGHDG